MTLCVSKGWLLQDWRSFYAIYLVACAVITTILNGTSLAILCKRSMRSHESNNFVTSLAVSDTIVGLVLCPLIAMSCLTKNEEYYCTQLTISGVLFCIIVGSSASSLAAIAYDRYLIVSPNDYHSKMTLNKSRLILFLCWCVPLAMIILNVFKRQLYIFAAAAHALLLLIVIAVSYRLIVKRISCQVTESNNINRNNNNTHINDSESNLPHLSNSQRNLRIARNKKISHRLLILIAAYCICLLPGAFSSIIGISLGIAEKGTINSLGATTQFSNRSMHLRMIGATGGVLNSVFNPIIYVFTYPKFKAEIKKIFPWLFSSVLLNWARKRRIGVIG